MKHTIITIGAVSAFSCLFAGSGAKTLEKAFCGISESGEYIISAYISADADLNSESEVLVRFFVGDRQFEEVSISPSQKKEISKVAKFSPREASEGIVSLQSCGDSIGKTSVGNFMITPLSKGGMQSSQDSGNSENSKSVGKEKSFGGKNVSASGAYAYIDGKNLLPDGNPPISGRDYSALRSGERRIYVDSSRGDDSNNGGEKLPKRTIAAAKKAVYSKDAIVLKASEIPYLLEDETLQNKNMTLRVESRAVVRKK